MKTRSTEFCSDSLFVCNDLSYRYNLMYPIHPIFRNSHLQQWLNHDAKYDGFFSHYFCFLSF